ncbi:DNA-(apurinic or apyrimidinic site) endonuclease 2-like [Lotus japonicus]|uniref:DNA-(apurinic or apyrimidinic site) endonuclease 2-like n=1 Tax=Lotus japonicus TaxID=34305 RepID=UPI00258C83DA|nr:DNA-(apurinic or apyrimidinic site) endonuclease 2-like [Lotus japonicus]
MNPNIWGKIPNSSTFNLKGRREMSGSSRSRLPQRPSKKPMGSSSSGMNDGVPHCKCGEEAVVRVSKTDANPGKPFYSCYLPKGHLSNCNFFRWVEDGNEVESNAPNLLMQEVVLMKEAILKKNEMVIEQIRYMNAAMCKNNDLAAQQVQLMRICVILMTLFVFVMMIGKFM